MAARELTSNENKVDLLVCKRMLLCREFGECPLFIAAPPARLLELPDKTGERVMPKCCTYRSATLPNHAFVSTSDPGRSEVSIVVPKGRYGHAEVRDRARLASRNRT